MAVPAVNAGLTAAAVHSDSVDGVQHYEKTRAPRVFPPYARAGVMPIVRKTLVGVAESRRGQEPFSPGGVMAGEALA